VENVTLGQLSNVLLFIVEFVGVIVTIIVAIKKILDKQLKPINNKIDALDKNQCRNYLVEFLADIEQGISKDETQIKRAYEVYDHYSKDLNGNSYIHDKWERLMR
jgi:tRNA A37 N6-isopentenylltransferase MiaA